MRKLIRAILVLIHGREYIEKRERMSNYFDSVLRRHGLDG